MSEQDWRSMPKMSELDDMERWTKLRLFVNESKPPLPPDFLLPPRSEEEQRVKTQIIHTLMALADGSAPDTCDCDSCEWTREQLKAFDWSPS